MDKHSARTVYQEMKSIFFFFSLTSIKVILNDFKVCGDFFALFLFTKPHFYLKTKIIFSFYLSYLNLL